MFNDRRLPSGRLRRIIAFAKRTQFGQAILVLVTAGVENINETVQRASIFSSGFALTA